jgi:hypothetical protein
MAGRMVQVTVRPSNQKLVFAVIVDDSLSYVETTNFINEQALVHIRENVTIGVLYVRDLPAPDPNDREPDFDLPV